MTHNDISAAPAILLGRWARMSGKPSFVPTLELIAQVREEEIGPRRARRESEAKLERIIRPIVEGQIRGFLKEHPAIAEAVDWYAPRKSKSETFVNSLAKRIVRDLLCRDTTARMAAVFVESGTAAPSESSVAWGTANDGGSLGTSTERAVCSVEDRR